MAADFHRNAHPQRVLSPFMKDSQKQKAEHYRERATQRREMAATAPTDGDLKDKLLDLASQYDRLAERASSNEFLTARGSRAAGLGRVDRLGASG